MLLLEHSFSAANSLLSHTHGHLHSPGLDNLDLSLLAESKSASEAVAEAELNDFNIAQLQMEYDSASIDTDLNTMHTLSSIDIHDHNNTHHIPHLDTDHDLDNTDSDYDARRMSSASAQSANTSSTAATSHSGFSAHHGLKRAQSPDTMDEYDSYDAFEGSPRAKRPRPSLSLEPGSQRMDSASPAPTNTTASAGGATGDPNPGQRMQLPPLFSALENTSSSAPPTSHGAQAPFTQSGNPIQLSYPHFSHSPAMGQGQGQGQSFPTSNFAFSVTGTGLDLRRGSLPSLYSNSLAARSAQRVPNQGQYTQNQMQRYSSYSSGMSPGPSPLSSLSAPDSSNDASGLAGYQFPGSSSSDSNGSNGSGSTPTQTPNTGSGVSPFSSGMTPTSTLSSGPNSSFPQTPLDLAHQHSSNYQNAYGHQQQHQAPNQNQKEYERFTKDYLTNGGEWASIARPASTPSSASAANTPASASAPGGFGFNASSGGLGGLPRISGHAKTEQQQQEWFSPAGQLVLPSPNANSSTHQHPQTASLSPSPRLHPSSSSSSSATAAVAAATAAALNVSPAAAVQAAQVAAQVAARPARRRGKLPKPTTDFLKDWLHRHSDHPYPSEEEKKQLCHATGLSMSQVSNWMINARRRILAPAQRAPQGPTTTVPSFPLGNSHSSSATRTPLGLSPAHSHSHGGGHHHGLSSSQQQHLSHSQSNNYGMGMNSGLGLGLMSGMGGMGGMGYAQQQGQHSLHAAQGLGMGGAGMYQQQQQQQQQQQAQYRQHAMSHPTLYDLGLHAQRRASMPALALHSQAQHLSSFNGNNNGSLSLYPPSGGASRNSLPGPLPQIGMGYSQQQQQGQGSYSPQPGGMGSPASAASAPTPQRGYVFPSPATGSVENGR